MGQEMIKDLEREQFVKILHTHLSPTSPIESEEHLFGRSKQLQSIEQALCAPGRSIFVYGDRGVGKTSLAQTVAYSHQSSICEP
jgi:replication-associated recombination protein RarA